MDSMNTNCSKYKPFCNKTEAEKGLASAKWMMVINTHKSTMETWIFCYSPHAGLTQSSLKVCGQTSNTSACKLDQDSHSTETHLQGIKGENTSNKGWKALGRPRKAFTGCDTCPRGCHWVLTMQGAQTIAEGLSSAPLLWDYIVNIYV